MAIIFQSYNAENEETQSRDTCTCVHAHSSLPCVCFSLLLPPPFFSQGEEVYPCSPAVHSQTGTSSKDRSIKVNRQDRK